MRLKPSIEKYSGLNKYFWMILPLVKLGRSSRLLFVKCKWRKSTNILKMRSLGVQILCMDCVGILSLLGVWGLSSSGWFRARLPAGCGFCGLPRPAEPSALQREAKPSIELTQKLFSSSSSLLSDQDQGLKIPPSSFPSTKKKADTIYVCLSPMRIFANFKPKILNFLHWYHCSYDLSSSIVSCGGLICH